MNQFLFIQKIAVTIVAAYLRNTPVTRGRWRLVHIFLPKLREIGYLMGTRVIRTRFGFKMRVGMNDWIGQHLYMTGLFEPDTSKLICSLVHAGDVVVDVGANIGYFTLLAAQKVGSTGRVIAFEPMPRVKGTLENNVRMNQCVNVVIYDMALSDADGVVTMYEGPEYNLGLSSMRKLFNAGRTHEIKSLRFDSHPESAERAHLIKIDVEGAEQLVIEGMEDYLNRYHPHLIVEVTEGFLNEFGHSASSLSQRLIAFGYRMYDINDGRLEVMPDDPSVWPRQFNALFTTAKDLKGCI